MIKLLQEFKSNGVVLPAPILSYAHFPIDAILLRNEYQDIPDQILERLFTVLGLLFEDWWWTCSFDTWKKTFMMAGAVIGDIIPKGKHRARDNETKCAAVKCLDSLLYLRAEEHRPAFAVGGERTRFLGFQSQVNEPAFIPIFGETINALVTLSEVPYFNLQETSLKVLNCIISSWATDALVPSILPGVVSTMCKVLLGVQVGKGWTNGSTVAGALRVLQNVIIRSIGNDICIREGATRQFQDLEDFVNWSDEPLPKVGIRQEFKPYQVARTTSWLRATASQIHIAINSISPLVSHPTPSALSALTDFSTEVLRSTTLTLLPQTQSLLLSFLLSLSNSIYPRISSTARKSLLSMLATPSQAQYSLVQALARITRENLTALPRFLGALADNKVSHVAGLIEAVCNLAVPYSALDQTRITTISSEIGKLLGPTGGIEKWGWNLLSVLELTEPHSIMSGPPPAQLMLSEEGFPESVGQVPFPQFSFKNVSSRDTINALERMMNALGRAGEERCLFAVEWFVQVARNDVRSQSTSALWCAIRILEGVAGVSLANPNLSPERSNKQLERLARSLTKSISEMWDEPEGVDPLDTNGRSDPAKPDDSALTVQLGQGFNTVNDTLNIIRPTPVKHSRVILQPITHRALRLNLIAICAGVLGARFSSLFISTLYPILHSLVSPLTFLSSTAFACLNYVTVVTSYASPANMLLSNFDYALDSISRRLTRRWLDVDATKVLVVLIRLVGSDMVNKAGDVVEECFDRLDEFHGYGIIVEGLIEVLGEVVKVIEADAPTMPPSIDGNSPPDQLGDVNSFLSWFLDRHNKTSEEEDKTDYGPAPHRAWGKTRGLGGDSDDEESGVLEQQKDPNEGPPATATQALTKQIVARSIFFLTHGSPIIRAHILTLLSSSVPVLSESALLPSIHSAWPFILNRLSDREPYVITSAARLIEALTTQMGSFMFRRIWDDVWPKFQSLLNVLDTADSHNALARRGWGSVGTESAYTQSHRLYRSIIRTMSAVARGVHPHEPSTWQVILAFRKFLHEGAHEELQSCARDLYLVIGQHNPDAIWLALTSTMSSFDPSMRFLRVDEWDIQKNALMILKEI